MIFQILIVVFFIGLVGCESKVHFLANEETDCFTQKVEDEDICVKKNQQVFHVEGLQDTNVTFLFVLDVSDSMKDDLVRVGDSFEPLMSQIEETKWRMFFTTADHGDHDFIKDSSTNEPVFTQQNWQDYKGDKPYFGRFMKLEKDGKLLEHIQLNKKIPDYSEVFKQTLTWKRSDNRCQLAPFCQGALEQPLRALNSSLERLSQEPSLLDSSHGDVIAFLITDEDERVEDSKNATTAQQVVDRFHALFPKRDFHAFTMVIQDENCLLNQKQYSPKVTFGKKVSELVHLTRGKSLSLCSSDYQSAFEEVSYLLRTLIEEFSLEEVPISPQHVKVEFLKGEKKNWTLIDNKIVFDSPLSDGSQIQVSYWVIDEKFYKD